MRKCRLASAGISVMTQRTPPTTDIKTSESEPAVTNFDRLLEVLERNAASAHEPELARRLREAIRAMRERRRG